MSCINDPKVKSTADNTPSEDKGVLALNVATRTTEGQTQRDYTLCIYKNEEGKQTLVRKYDSSNEEMLKPEYIWLLEGNYHAVVESGKAVAKTFSLNAKSSAQEFETAMRKLILADSKKADDNSDDLPVEV